MRRYQILFNVQGIQFTMFLNAYSTLDAEKTLLVRFPAAEGIIMRDQTPVIPENVIEVDFKARKRIQR